MSGSTRRIVVAAVLLLLTLGITLAATASATGPTVTVYSAGVTAGSGPNAITTGPDGAMWFTEYHGNRIGRVSNTGAITEYPSSGSPLAAGADPAGIVTGPDDKLYFSEFESGGNGAIGELNPATGQLVGEYATPTAGSEPDGITVGRDGGIWFAEQGTAATLGRLDPTTDTITQYQLNGSSQLEEHPTDVVTGPDGALWVTLLGSGQIARIDPSQASPGTSDGVTRYDLPSGAPAEPEGIAVGPDGDLYVAEYGTDQVARIVPSQVQPETDDGITEYPVGGAPLLITAGQDGGMWLTEPNANQVVRFDVRSNTVSATLGGSQGVSGEPTGIADDGSDHLWFTEFSAPAVATTTLATTTTTSTSTTSGPPPSEKSAPQITGTPQAGQTLTCIRGTWSTIGTTIYTETWTETQVRSLPGVKTTVQIATGPTVTLADYPPGATVDCTVTVGDSGGDASATAPAVTILARKPALAAELPLHTGTAPSIDSGLGIGKTNTCTHGSWQHYPTAYRYAWYVVPSPTAAITAGTRVGGKSTLQITKADQDGYLVCAVTASNAAGATVAESNRYYVLEPDLGIDVNAMEITQGVQTSELPTRSASDPAADHVAYHGVVLPWQTDNTPTTVLLAAGHATVVRVYVDLRFPLGDNAIPTMTLTASRDGKVLAPGPIGPDELPGSEAFPVGALGQDPGPLREDPDGAYTFTLPQSWTQGDVSFTAQANPGVDALPNCVSCKVEQEERTLVLGPEQFRPVASLYIDPLAFTLTTRGVTSYPAGYPNIDPAWYEVQAVQPLTLHIAPYQAVLDATPEITAGSITQTSCTLLVFCSSQTITPSTPANAFYIAQSSLLEGAVADWAQSNDSSSSRYPFGLVPASNLYSGGITAAFNGRIYNGPEQPRSIATEDRPINAIAHELNHGLGLVHSDLICGGNASPSTGNAGEPWPPNNDGALDGIGLDTSQPSPYTIPHTTAAQTMYDLMSYCANENTAWISVRNWNRDVLFDAPAANAHTSRANTRALHANGRQPAEVQAWRPPLIASGARTLAVTALDQTALSQVAIFSIAADTGPPTPVTTDDKYELVGRNAAGQVVTTAGAPMTIEHADGQPSQLMIQGRILAAGVDQIDIVSNGQTLARDVASAHAPTVTLLSPRARTTLGKGGHAVIRWRSHDADGGPLTVTVRYSPNGGRTYRTIYQGPDQNHITLAGGLLSRSRDARVVVDVSDGFHDAITVSPRFSALGAAPTVAITSPGHAVHLLAGGALSLQASAADDAGHPLTGRHLVWRAGRRVLGHGATLTTRAIQAGRQRITVTASDRFNRSASAHLTVTVVPAPPILTKVRAPRRIGARAKQIRIGVATEIPDQLTVGQIHLVTGPRLRWIRVRVRPSRHLLNIILTLRSGHDIVRAPLVIHR